jgi:hypothetical protein
MSSIQHSFVKGAFGAVVVETWSEGIMTIIPVTSVAAGHMIAFEIYAVL